MKKVSSKKSILILVVAIVIVIMCILIFNAQKDENTNPSEDNYIGDEYLNFEEESGDEWLETVNANIELSEKEVLGENVKVTVKLDNDENIDSVILCPLQDKIFEIGEIEATKIDDGVYEAEIKFEELNAEDGDYQFKAILRDNNGNKKEIISEDTVNYSKTGVSYAHAYKKEDGRTAVQITALDKGEVLVSTTNVAPTADDTRWTKYEAGEEYIIATPEENVENVYVWYKNGENIINAADSGISVMSFEDGLGVIMKEYYNESFSYKTPVFNNKSYQRKDILTITLSKTYEEPVNPVSLWDISKNKDKSVMAYTYKSTEDSTKYDLYICGKGVLIAPKYSNDLFCEYTDCKEIKGLENLDVSNVTLMNDMFSGCRELKSLEDLSSWDVSNVTNMGGMFNGCRGLTSVDGLSSWNVGNVTGDGYGYGMSYMFHLCSGLTSIEALKDWNVSNASFYSMFWDCSGLTSLEPLKNWNVSNSTDMLNMFRGCSGLTSLEPLKDWSVGNVTDMGGMFAGCSGLTSIEPIKSWNVSNVTNMNSMFDGCNGLTSIEPIKSWNVGNVTDMAIMFKDCNLTFADLSNWNTVKLKYNGGMFCDCKLKYLLLGNSFGKIQSSRAKTKPDYRFTGSSITHIITLREEPMEFSQYLTYKYQITCWGGLYVKNSTSNPTIEQMFEEADTVGMFGTGGIREVIELVGDSEITVTMANGYTDPGVTVAGYPPKDLEEFPELGLTFEVDTTEVDNALANKTPGEYTVTYTLKYNGEVFSTKTRKVTVTAYYKNDTNQYFATLADAFNETASGGTITVLENVTESIRATNNKTLTLDLNSKTIDASGVTGDWETGREFIQNQGTLTIVDTGKKGSILRNNVDSHVCIVSTTGTLNLKGGTFSLSIGNIRYDPSTIAVDDGITNIYDGVNIIATRTVIDQWIAGIYAPGGILNMYGGNVEATGIEGSNTVYGIINRANGTSKINISGGTVRSTGKGIALENHGENIINTQLSVSGNANINGNIYGIYNSAITGGITIDGGTITGKTAGIYQTVANNITTSGTITGEEYGIYNSGNGDISALGGKIEGKSLNGIYILGSGKTTITKTTIAGHTQGIYSKNANAIVEINSGSTITSTAESTSAIGMELGTLTVNGGTITGNASGIGATTPNSEGSVNITINGGKIEGKTLHGIGCTVNGNIVIGTPQNGVSTSNPEIIGAINGISCTNGFKFYDGILKGKEGAFSGTVTELESGYGVHYDTDSGYKTAYLVAANYKDNASPENTYDTLANAFNKVATGKTIAVIGENVQESTRATLTDNKSIILDLNGKTITYTSEFIGVIDATLEVKDSKDNGEINNTTNYFSGLYYHSNGNIIISGGTIKGLRGISRSDYGAVGASVTMTGGQINATSTCIDVTTEDTVVITDGKLISNTGIGINYAQDESGRLVGSLTIGTKGGTTNTQTPMIQGATYGVISTNGFNFYDGILKGKEGAFNGTVTEVETDYGIHYDIDGDYKTAYLVVANYEDNANPKNTYAKLDDAFNKVASGRTITALKDLTEVGSNRIILEANKDITLNLNNKTITINNITSGAVMWGEIINKGNLTINGKGTITTSTENNNITTLISTENGTLTVDKDVTIEHKGIDFSTYYTLNFIGNYNANIYGKITVNTRETENEKTSGATAINTTGSGTLNIIGATVLAQGTNDSKGYAIRIAGISDIEGTINIKDSNIKSSIGWAIDSYADPESSNKYKVNIENSTIEGTNYGINTDFIGEIEITVKDNAEIRSDNIALVINNNNSVKVLGGLIQGEKIGIENDSGSGAKGKIEIVSGTVKGGSNGITGWGTSTIIIGQPGENVDVANPTIEGTDYGINTSGKNIEFYDGILKGKTAAYNVRPNKVETGYGIYDGEEDGYKVAYLKKIATIVATPTEITLIYGDSGEISYTCNGDGEITANVEDSNISEITLDTSAKKVGVKSHKVGETIVTISMAGTDEYLATSIEVPVTVIQKEIAVIWLPDQDKYEYTYNGQLQGPDVQKELESALGEIITFGVRGKEKDAGSYTAEAYIVSITNGVAENYKVTNTNKEFVINRKDITVKADANQGKGPGEPEPDLTFTYEGNVAGEIPGFTGSLAREEGEGGGRYRIRRGTLELADTDTFKAGNYNLVFIDEDTEFVISYDKEKELILVFKITDTNNKLILPIPASTSNDYIVIWGDNNSDMYTKEGFPEHIYEKAGTYTVEIGGTVKNFGYYNSLRPTDSNIYNNYLSYTNQLTGIEQLGDVDAERIGFAFCENLTGDIPEANLDLSDLVSAENMFNNCVLLQGPIPTNLLAGAEKVNSAKNMFLNCESLTGTIPANLFADTAEITTFESTFNNCKNLDGTIPAELFANGENVTTYAGTFKNCANLDGEIPTELFGKSTRVTTFKETFSNCTGLNTTISPKLFGTNPYVKNYYRTFYNCTGITGTIDENVFGSNVSITEIPDKDLNSNYKETFKNCTGITDVRLISLVIGKEMFKDCTSIKTLKLEKTIDIGEKAFEGCNTLTQIEANNDYLRTIGIDAFEYTGTNPEKLLTKINRENEILLNYIWNDDNRLIDVEPPKGTVEIITPRDPYTNNENVTLKITVEDNYSKPSNCKMVIMNEREYNEFANREYKDYDSLPWQDYAETVAWTLTSNDDLKTVYVLFKDEFGNANVVKDTIN